MVKFLKKIFRRKQKQKEEISLKFKYPNKVNNYNSYQKLKQKVTTITAKTWKMVLIIYVSFMITNTKVKAVPNINYFVHLPDSTKTIEIVAPNRLASENFDSLVTEIIETPIIKVIKVGDNFLKFQIEKITLQIEINVDIPFKVSFNFPVKKDNTNKSQRSILRSQERVEKITKARKREQNRYMTITKLRERDKKEARQGYLLEFYAHGKKLLDILLVERHLEELEKSKKEFLKVSSTSSSRIMTLDKLKVKVNYENNFKRILMDLEEYANVKVKIKKDKDNFIIKVGKNSFLNNGPSGENYLRVQIESVKTKVNNPYLENGQFNQHFVHKGFYYTIVVKKI